MSPARRRADQLPFCAAVAYAAHPLLGHGAIFFPVVAKGGVERYGGVANSLSGPPSPGQLALPAALGTRWSPCRRPSRDAQTEDLRSPTSTGLGRGVAAPFARRRPNRECALTRWGYMQTTTQRHSASARRAAPFGSRTPRSAIRQPHTPAAPFGSRCRRGAARATAPRRHTASAATAHSRLGSRTPAPAARPKANDGHSSGVKFERVRRVAVLRLQSRTLGRSDRDFHPSGHTVRGQYCGVTRDRRRARTECFTPPPVGYFCWVSHHKCCAYVQAPTQ